MSVVVALFGGAASRACRPSMVLLQWQQVKCSPKPQVTKVNQGLLAEVVAQSRWVRLLQHKQGVMCSAVCVIWVEKAGRQPMPMRRAETH